jgi:DNA-binding transcriptional MerR regulator
MTSAPADAPRTYTITELSNEFDITPRAIRFYEDVGLLEPARDGRNRVYTLRDRTRLKLTLRGKRLGILRQHRSQLEQQLEDLQVTLAEIAQHEERCLRMLEGRSGDLPDAID